jgi:hypothetical protein
MEKTVINLNEKRVDESWLGAFGAQMRHMIDLMGFPGLQMGSNYLLRGTPTQIRTFMDTLRHERRHMDAAKRYGLLDPRTHASSTRLNQAVKNFERATGIKYPIK